jgi:nitroreductase
MMHNGLKIIYDRRAVKNFDAHHVISLEEKKTIIQAAKQAPSSFNIQHWRLLDITDNMLRKNLRLAAWNQSQVTDASMLLIVCVDLNAHTNNPEQYWKNSPQEVQEMLVAAIGNFYANNLQLQRDEAMRSAGLISQTIMLSAQAIGYDSCPMIGIDFNKVAELIKLPKNHEIAMLIAIGKALQPAREKGGFIDDSLFLKENTF